MLVSRQDAFLATCNLYQFILLRLVSLSCKIYQLQILLVLLDLFIIMVDIPSFFEVDVLMKVLIRQVVERFHLIV